MARVGQFGLNNTTYGQKVATVQPVDNKVSATQVQQAQAEANAQAQYLVELINQVRQQQAPRPPATPTK